jgi:hypothetical protein
VAHPQEAYYYGKDGRPVFWPVYLGQLTGKTLAQSSVKAVWETRLQFLPYRQR